MLGTKARINEIQELCNKTLKEYKTVSSIAEVIFLEGRASLARKILDILQKNNDSNN